MGKQRCPGEALDFSAPASWQANLGAEDRQTSTTPPSRVTIYALKSATWNRCYFGSGSQRVRE